MILLEKGQCDEAIKIVRDAIEAIRKLDGRAGGRRELADALLEELRGPLANRLVLDLPPAPVRPGGSRQ